MIMLDTVFMKKLNAQIVVNCFLKFMMMKKSENKVAS